MPEGTPLSQWAAPEHSEPDRQAPIRGTRRLRPALEANLLEALVDAIPALMDEHALQELARRLQPLLGAANQEHELMDEPRLLTCHEAALRARVHVETIYRAVRSGAIPVAAKIGRSPRISQSALDSWLAAPTARLSSPEQKTHVRPRGPMDGRAASLRDVWT